MARDNSYGWGRNGYRCEAFPVKGGSGFRFRRIARNGEKTTPSQTYASRQGARRAARQQFPNDLVVSVGQ